MLSVIMPSVIMLCAVILSECNFVECRGAKKVLIAF
jgi:hypothetical protein